MGVGCPRCQPNRGQYRRHCHAWPAACGRAPLTTTRSASAASPAEGAKPECTLESGRWTLRGYLTHQDSSEAPGAGRTASGFPPNGHSLATRRAYFEAGMLRQMNDMHGYRSPRRRGRLAGSVFWVQRRVSRVCVNSRCSTLTPLRLVTLVVSLDKADALIDGMYSRIITKLPRVFSQAGSFNPETLAGSMSDCRKAFVAGRDLTQEYNSARMAALSCGCPRKRESY